MRIAQLAYGLLLAIYITPIAHGQDSRMRFVESRRSIGHASESGYHSCRLVRENAFVRIPAPTIYKQRKALQKAALSNISVRNWGSAPEEAKQAIGYAIDIWSQLITSSQPIGIDVSRAISFPRVGHKYSPPVALFERLVYGVLERLSSSDGIKGVVVS